MYVLLLGQQNLCVPVAKVKKAKPMDAAVLLGDPASLTDTKFASLSKSLSNPGHQTQLLASDFILDAPGCP